MKALEKKRAWKSGALSRMIACKNKLVISLNVEGYLTDFAFFVSCEEVIQIESIKGTILLRR